MAWRCSLLINICIIVHVYSQCVKFDLSSVLQNNKRLKHGFWNLSMPSYAMCLVHCQFFAACMSVNFYRDVGICEMNEATALDNPAAFLDAKNVVYAVKQANGLAEQVLPSACQTNPCKGREMCYAVGEGHKCIIKDCPEPVVRTNIRHLPTARPYRVGSNISYTCDAPYVALTGSVVDTCSAAGVWEPNNYTCILCDAPPSVEHAEYSLELTPAGTVAHYTCKCPIPPYAGPPFVNDLDPHARCTPVADWFSAGFKCTIDCYTTPVRQTYRGVYYNQTETAIPCQRWDVSTPHENKMDKVDSAYIDGSIRAAENYCRDPENNSPGFPPWCYRDVPGEPTWENCGVPRCSDC